MWNGIRLWYYPSIAPVKTTDMHDVCGEVYSEWMLLRLQFFAESVLQFVR